MLKALLIVAMSAASSIALAQGSGTEQERQACSPDVKRFCIQVVDQGDLAILGCLKQNRPNISAACNKVLTDHGQ